MKLFKNLFGRIKRLANEVQTALVGLTNEISDGEWLQLSPLGDFPHAQGLQRVDRAAAEAMANHFNGILASAKRALFGGVPFFEGHPDVPGLSNEYRDKTAKGWIKALEARDDGLYGRIEWNPRGKEMIANKEYKFFSPYWEAKQIGNANGRPIYQPTQLLSVGLTNTPNLPVRPLANEAHAQQIEALTNEITALKANSVDKAAFEAAKTELANARTELASERKERITLILDNAIRDKRLTIAERPEWESKFTADFANAQTALSARKEGTLNTTSQTGDLGSDKRTLENESARRTTLANFIDQKMKAGKTYEQAWALAKIELKSIFEQMGKR